MNDKLRADFPLLQEVIYLDNAATSLTPEPVLKAMLGYYREYRANVGRSVHRLAQIATQRYKEAHRKVAAFIGAHEGEVIFTKNTTEAINMVAYGLPFEKGDEVVTTLLEHHSNFLPWLRLREKGVLMRLIKPDKEGKFELADFERAIGPRTKLVAVSRVSNVLGTISPIEAIGALCREKGAPKLLVDGAQSVPHLPTAVEELGCDFLAFSGHKMLGPTGTGVLWAKNPEDLNPVFLGGGIIETVTEEEYHLTGGYERFEAGTPHIAGGIGLGRAVEYLTEVGMARIQEHEARLTRRLLNGLQELDRVQVHGPQDAKGRLGVISFTISGLHPHEVAVMLDEAADIMVRSGHHCCMPLMHYLGLKEGTVRASLYLYNTAEEIDRFLETVEKITEVV